MLRKKLWIPFSLTAVAALVWAFVRPDDRSAASFRFVAVERGAIESVVTSTGTLQATETVEVGTQVSGQIADLLVDFNSRVKMGQLLARIDATILQERSFERVGGSRTIEVDVRWIAATNRDLDEMVRAGAFREDLYHRLAVFPVELPPLRERSQDIAPLAETLLARISADLGRPPLRLDDEARTRIAGAAWGGNVRELANTLERAAILSEGDVIRGRDLMLSTLGNQLARRAEGRTMMDIERDAIRRALDEVGGNRRLAAERLGMGLRTLYDKLKRYELD